MSHEPLDDKLLLKVRAARPAPPDDHDSPFSPAAQRVLTRALSSQQARPGTEKVPRPGRSAPRLQFRRWGLTGLVATGAAVAILIVAGLLPGRETSETQLGAGSASAAVFLDHAARAAERQPWQPLASGQYDFQLHVENYNYLKSDRAVGNQAMTQEAWVAANGSGRILQHRPGVGSIVIPFGSRKPVVEQGIHMERQPFIWPAGGAEVTYRQLIHLPTDPAALRRWIERHSHRPSGTAWGEDFTIVGDIMRLPAVPPALRAAMFRVVAHLPGVVLVGRTRDELGRRGVAVGFPNGIARNDLIFNPKTGMLLGERTVSLSRKAGAPPGTIIGWSLNVLEAIVRSDHHQPRQAIEFEKRHPLSGGH